MRTLFFAAALLLSACATSAQHASDEPTRPYGVVTPNATVDVSLVQDRRWQPDNSILLKTYRGDWYHLVLLGGCTHAGYMSAIGFSTFSSTLDRSSAVLAGGQRCPLASIDKIQPPPRA